MDREVSSNALARAHIESILEYSFSTVSLLLEALWTAGPTRIGLKKLTEGNKQLALVGDAVIRVVLVQDSYHIGLKRGTVQAHISQFLSNAHLAEVGFAKQIDKFVTLNAGTPQVSSATMATTVKAIFGAIFVDSQDLNLVHRAMILLGILDR